MHAICRVAALAVLCVLVPLSACRAIAPGAKRPASLPVTASPERSPDPPIRSPGAAPSPAGPTALVPVRAEPVATASPSPTVRPGIEFAVIGDYGQAGEPAAAVAQLVRAWQPDFVVTVGDNNYEDGAAATLDDHVGQYYHQFIAPYRGRYGPGADRNRFFHALGNHDWLPGDAAPYLAYFNLPEPRRYYAIDWPPLALFVLDSDPHEPAGVDDRSTQAKWLQAALARSTACWKIVAFHHPPFTSGSKYGSARWMAWPFREWGADLVVSGHEHVYERVLRDDFPYLVNGLGGKDRYRFGLPIPGSQVRFNEDFGALRATADRAALTWQFVTRAGQTVDSFRLTKSCPVG